MSARGFLGIPQCHPQTPLPSNTLSSCLRIPREVSDLVAGALAIEWEELCSQIYFIYASASHGKSLFANGVSSAHTSVK